MSGNAWKAWRGIPADRLPASVARRQLTHLHAAIDSERERVHTLKRDIEASEARSTDASGEGIEPDGEPLADTGADRGEPEDGEGVQVRELLQVARNIFHNVLATPFYALRCAVGWHTWQHVRRLSFPDHGAMPIRWRSYDVCAHCRRINLASETSEPWRPSDADGEQEKWSGE